MTEQASLADRREQYDRLIDWHIENLKMVMGANLVGEMDSVEQGLKMAAQGLHSLYRKVNRDNREI